MVIKAQSLIHTIYLCLVLALLIGSLFILRDVRTILVNHYDELSDHLFTHLKIRDAYLTNKDYNHIDEKVAVNSIDKKSFGLYKYLNISTVLSEPLDTISTSWVLGYQQPDFGMYIPDKGNEIGYHSNNFLSGNLVVPSINVSNAHFKLKKGSISSSLIQKGDMKNSEKTLPVLHSSFELPEVGAESRFRESELSTDVVNNTFTQETIELTWETTTVSDISLSGNIILKSLNKLYIGPDAQLNGIIVTAPKVIIQTGFKGSLQVFATNEIEIGSNVLLDKQSVLWLESNTQKDRETAITIDSNSIIKGSIVLKKNDDASPWLYLKKSSEVQGVIYNEGITQAEGDVYGSLITEDVGVKSGKSISLNSFSGINLQLTQYNKSLLRINYTNINEAQVVKKI